MSPIARNIFELRHSYNNEVQSTASQIVQEIEVIQGVVLPGISKLYDSAPNKKPEYQTQFYVIE